MARWALVVGPRGVGKSGLVREAVARLRARGIAVAGFFQEPIDVEGTRTGYVVERATTGQRAPLARSGTPAKLSEELVCSFVFDRDGFEEAQSWLDADRATAEVIVIDELGKLEARGEGHARSVELALATDAVLLLSVRADNLAPIVERFGIFDDALAILSCGTGDDQAGLETFVAAVAAAVTPPTPLRAGDVDWEVRCREMAQAAHVWGGPGEDRWARRAARFAKISRDRDGLVDTLAPMLEHTDVVVDIGAGTGRHAVPLARRVAHVIALEPSASMREHLEARVAEEQLANVSIVGKPWPAPLDRAFDVALSSHVLYGVEDAVSFIRAMSHARRLAVLYLSPRPPISGLDPLWASLYGAPRPQPPGALEILNLLWQLGHAAELRVVEGSARPFAFADDGEDLVELCLRVNVEPDDEGRARVREHLHRVARRTPDGRWQLGTLGPHVLLSWPTQSRLR
ncbi:DUF2478 domain-containing protein [Myxococcota bacterium]|nr:DUF2478 domain-containing protein [Myxococcota bacterium]